MAVASQLFAKAGAEDDRQIRVCFPNRLDQLGLLHAGHGHVGYQQIKSFAHPRVGHHPRILDGIVGQLGNIRWPPLSPKLLRMGRRDVRLDGVDKGHPCRYRR